MSGLLNYGRMAEAHRREHCPLMVRKLEDWPESEVEAARFRLNVDYNDFVGQFGPVSQSANVGAFAGDPDLPLLLTWSATTKTAIFRERTIRRRQPVLAASGAI